MKKFKSIEEGVWNEVVKTTSEDPNTDSEKTYVPASSEESTNLQAIYLANKPRLDENIEYKLISASIKIDGDSKSGKIKARINGRFMHIEIK
jgi:hypothetical protein